MLHMKRTQDSLILTSNIFNAFAPEFLKHLFINFLFFLPLFFTYLLLEYLFKLEFRAIALFSLIGLTILYSIIKISRRLFDTLNTKYIFTAYTIEKHWGYFSHSSHSLNYSQITDVELTMTFWDKLCNVGDLIIHTANDSHTGDNLRASLILHDIKNPKKLKQEMLQRVSQIKHKS